MQSEQESVQVLGHQAVRLTDTLAHHEIVTTAGLLTLLWHGTGREENVVIACAGAMGGLLGPSHGLYHDLGESFGRSGLAAVIRVGWRRPNDLDSCTRDTMTALALAADQGAKRAVIIGHSFGGAPAIRAAALSDSDDDFVRGVVTLATQSAGCEFVSDLAELPLLCVHGEADEVIPVRCSEMVAEAGHGQLVLLPGVGHLMLEARTELRTLVADWIISVLGTVPLPGSALPDRTASRP